MDLPACHGCCFRVRINEAYSESKPVLSGVPQGSVLGLLLFLIFVSDMMGDIQASHSFFADDCKLFVNPLMGNTI